MAQPKQSALPTELQLDGGTIVRVTAIDPTTGNTVVGVSVSNVSLYVTDLNGGSGQSLVYGTYRLVPGPNA